MGWGMITICNSCGHRSETIRAGFTCGSDIMAKRPYGDEQCGGTMQPQPVNVGDVWRIPNDYDWTVTKVEDGMVSLGRQLSVCQMRVYWLQALGERIEP